MSKFKNGNPNTVPTDASSLCTEFFVLFVVYTHVEKICSYFMNTLIIHDYP